MKNAAIALEDGTIFYGRSFGADGIRDGEVVFNTSMTGYQEILTDPSYKGQIVTMTTPQIGNYGINPADNESWMPQVEGFIVKEISPVASNFRSHEELSAFLKRHNIIAIQGVDTRALTRHIRIGGAIKAVVSTVDITPEILIEKAEELAGPHRPRPRQGGHHRQDLRIQEGARRPLVDHGPCVLAARRIPGLPWWLSTSGSRKTYRCR